MNVTQTEFDPQRADAVFDLDGTLFKFTVLEQYTNWLSAEGVFEPIPDEIEEARLVWKRDSNTEASYNAHTRLLVDFFVGQVASKRVAELEEAARAVAGQTSYRQWDITRNIIEYLRPTHNVLAISHMPEWLMPPFTEDLGFVATLGSTYVEHEGVLTGEAYSINKGEVYRNLREGDTNKLDVAMGNTMGDVSMFKLAWRPIAFNPSNTLDTLVGHDITTVTAWADNVYITNPTGDPNRFNTAKSYCSEPRAVLEKVIRQHPLWKW